MVPFSRKALPDPGVDFAAREAGVMDRAMGHSGTLIRRAWEIAFMRHAHDLLHQSKSRSDLGRGRQERDDALHITDLFGPGAMAADR